MLRLSFFFLLICTSLTSVFGQTQTNHFPTAWPGTSECVKACNQSLAIQCASQSTNDGTGVNYLESCWQQCSLCGSRCTEFALEQSKWVDTGLNIPKVQCNFSCGATSSIPGGTVPLPYASGFISYERYAWRSCYIETPAAKADICSVFTTYVNGQAPVPDQCAYIKRFFSFPSIEYQRQGGRWCCGSQAGSCMNSTGNPQCNTNVQQGYWGTSCCDSAYTKMLAQSGARMQASIGAFVIFALALLLL